MSKNLIILAVVAVSSFYLFKGKKPALQEEEYKVVRQFHPVIEQPVNLKNSAIKKVTLVPPASESLSFEPQTLLKDDARIEAFKEVPFPNGKFVKRETLPGNSYYEIYQTAAGDTVTHMYHDSILTGSEWQMPNGRKVSRSYEDGRLIALAEVDGTHHTTLFYDSNSVISKRMESIDGKEYCTKYDRSGYPYEKNAVTCANDDYREYENVSEL